MSFRGLMPSGAARNGTTNDHAALQNMFNKMPWGAHVFIPDGEYRIVGQLTIPKSGWIICSPGAHLKFEMGGSSDASVYWNCINNVTDRIWNFMARWEGGNITRDNNNGPCLRTQTIHTGTIEDLVCYGGSPYIFVDCVWSSLSRWTPFVKVINCRGEGGGLYGIQIGSPPSSAGEANRCGSMNCHVVGNGASGSRGHYWSDGGNQTTINDCYKNYQTGILREYRARDSFIGVCRIVGASKDFNFIGSNDNEARNICIFGHHTSVLDAIDRGRGTCFGPNGYLHVNKSG